MREGSRASSFHRKTLGYDGPPKRLLEVPLCRNLVKRARIGGRSPISPSHKERKCRAQLKFPTPGQIARVRQRLYLVEQTVPPPNPGDSTLVSAVLRGRRRPRAAAGSALGTGDRPGDHDRRSVGGHCQAGLRSASALRRLPEHPPVELRHGDRTLACSSRHSGLASDSTPTSLSRSARPCSCHGSICSSPTTLASARRSRPG